MNRNQLSPRTCARAVAVATAVVAVVAISAAVAAELGEGAGPQAPAPAGTPAAGSAQLPIESAGQVETIVTDSTTFDPTILTKFISGRGFVAHQGPDGVDDDRLGYSGSTCISPNAGPGGGSFTDVYHTVELPNGARIKQIVFYGQDNAAGSDISISLFRNQITVPLLGSPTRADQLVTSFTTSGTTGVVAISSVDNLGEVTGSSSPSSLGSDHRFYVLDVNMINAATSSHVLCGIEVLYQVPVSAADPGTVFHPILPVRAYDSRIIAYPTNGPLTNNSSRVIDISAGHDLATGAVSLADAVPAGATAITYNLTTVDSTTTGFVSVTPGDAASFATSSLNLNGTALANGGTVSIAGDRTIKVWVGGGGSTQVIIDVTGYYAPPVPFPNLGN